MAASVGSTSSGLIERARNGDQKTWSELVACYGPLVFGWVRQAGVPPADTGDVVQNVFLAIVRGLPEFNHRSFRGWLRIVTRNKVMDYFRKHSKLPYGRGGSSLASFLKSIPEMDSLEYDSRLDECFGGMTSEQTKTFRKVVEEVREQTSPRCWKIFWSITVDEVSPEDIGNEFEMRLGTVYQCVSRTLGRLRKALQAKGL